MATSKETSKFALAAADCLTWGLAVDRISDVSTGPDPALVAAADVQANAFGPGLPQTAKDQVLDFARTLTLEEVVLQMSQLYGRIASLHSTITWNGNAFRGLRDKVDSGIARMRDEVKAKALEDRETVQRLREVDHVLDDLLLRVSDAELELSCLKADLALACESAARAVDVGCEEIQSIVDAQRPGLEQMAAGEGVIREYESYRQPEPSWILLCSSNQEDRVRGAMASYQGRAALRWLRKEAEDGNRVAFARLLEVLRFAQPLEWMRMASLGSVMSVEGASRTIGNALYETEPILALTFLQEGAILSGDGKAAMELARRITGPRARLRLLMVAREAGDPRALRVGTIIAANLFKAAMRKRNAGALYELGVCRVKGIWWAKDYIVGGELLYESARLGFQPALSRIERLCELSPIFLWFHACCKFTLGDSDAALSLMARVHERADSEPFLAWKLANLCLSGSCGATRDLSEGRRLIEIALRGKIDGAQRVKAQLPATV